MTMPIGNHPGQNGSLIVAPFPFSERMQWYREDALASHHLMVMLPTALHQLFEERSHPQSSLILELMNEPQHEWRGMDGRTGGLESVGTSGTIHADPFEGAVLRFGWTTAARAKRRQHRLNASLATLTKKPLFRGGK